MRGLTWGHILSMSIFTLLLVGIGTSTAPYSFNFQIIYNVWETTKTSIATAWNAQGEVAKRMDAHTKATYEGQVRQGICNPDTIDKSVKRIRMSDLAVLRNEMTREEVITAIGNPLCQTFSKDDIWEFEDERLFYIGGYNPLRTKIID